MTSASKVYFIWATVEQNNGNFSMEERSKIKQNSPKVYEIVVEHFIENIIS